MTSTHEANWLTKAQVEEILQYAKIISDRDYLLIRLLWVTGMRVSELLSVCPIDIRATLGVTSINIPNLKHKNRRDVFVDATTSRVLIEYIATQDKNEPVFPIKRNRVFGIVRKYGNMIGITELHPHTFRHSFVAYAESRGMPFKVIQKILGHNESYQGTCVYMHDGSFPADEYALLDF